jgi:hypothetical protein
MKRYGIWAISALVAVPVFLLTSASGMPGVYALVITFVGALVGSLLGTYVMNRQGPDKPAS